VEVLSEELSKMVEERSNMGFEDAERRRNKAQTKYSEYKDNNTRIEGRKQMLDEQKRALKRKLKLP
jgi:hypothetical protein